MFVDKTAIALTLFEFIFFNILLNRDQFLFKKLYFRELQHAAVLDSQNQEHKIKNNY